MLAELSSQGGSKFVTLQNRLGIGPTALRQTLKFLIERKVVIRNPGYGHPMRPEYLVTNSGKEIAKRCEELMAAVKDKNVNRVIIMKWALPILAAMAGGCTRFSQLRGSVNTITSRALTIFLKEALAAGVVERAVVDGYPPSPEYRLAPKVENLIPRIRHLLG